MGGKLEIQTANLVGHISAIDRKVITDIVEREIIGPLEALIDESGVFE